MSAINQPFEIGLYTFVEWETNPVTGQKTRLAHAYRKTCYETIELADQVGLDVFGIGEHHRPVFSFILPGSDSERRSSAH